MNLTKIVAVFLSVIGVCAEAYGIKTNYVDCTLGDYTGHDGTSWEKAFKTIQEGVDAAETDDVVLVAPGYYDEGGVATESNGMYITNRVYITKRITVRSRDGRATRDSTFIVGKHSANPEDPGALGLGSDAIRCVRISGTQGTVLEGFTLINGSTLYDNGVDKVYTRGGGVYFDREANTSDEVPSIVDCVISNCVAVRGGGMYYGNAVRCRFMGNAVNKNAPALRAANIYWCIVDANPSAGKAGQTALDGCKAINCTFANSDARAFKGNAAATLCSSYNVVALSYTSDASSTYVALTNCVIPEGVNFYIDNGTTTALDKCKRVAMGSHQFVSTATGDFRPLASSDLIEAGDSEHLKLIPEKYRYTDYEGSPVPETGAITVGAIVTPVEAKSGLLYYESAYRHADSPGVNVNGYTHYTGGLYSYSDRETPVAYAVECVMPTDAEKLASRTFYAYSAYYTNSVEGGSASTIYHPPLRDTNLAYLMPPPVGGSVKVSPKIAERSFWADPTVPDGAEMDGTEEKPYNTLQGAVDAAYATGVKAYYMIMAKPGVYDKGGVVYGGISNRVAFTQTTAYLRLYAVEGHEKTFIAGAGDPDSTNSYGYGPNAVRCVGSITGVSSINGFTLTGGRCSINEDGTETDGSVDLRGGGIYTSNSSFTIEDCVITNCIASRGSVAYGGVLRRCRIVDCLTSNNGALRGGVYASSCVFEGLQNSHIVGQNETAFNCTFIGSSDNCAAVTGSKAVAVGAGVYNSVVYGFNVLDKAVNYTIAGTYYDKVNGVSEEAAAIPGLVKVDIYLADEDAGDYRLCSVNLFKDGGDTLGLPGGFWRYGSAVDIEGMPYDFRADGSVEVGAYAASVPSTLLAAAVPEGVASVSVSPAGNTVLTEGESVTFTANDAAIRNFQGFYLNGELVTAESTYTYAFDGEKDGSHLRLEARYVPYWYVDPTKSDDNSGRSWAEAKQSLAEVMKLALPGDTVYAEAGTYEIGDMIQHANSFRADPLLRARVVITNGVSLISRRGPEMTVIKGRSATVDVDGYGGGTDALRCVYMYPDSRLEGFTLTGGRSYGEKDPQDDNNRGAGVHGWMNEFSLVKDCIISNCVASRGAGSTHVTAVNCRYLHNRAYNNTAASQHCFHHNCFFDWNVSGTGSSGGFVVAYWRGLRNCTFGANNFISKNVIGPSPDNNVQHPQVYNTLFLNGSVYAWNGDGVPGVFTNCAFTTAAFESWPTNCIYDEATIFADPEMLQADENGVPIVGRNVAIDRGDIRYVDTELCTTDLAGNPRAVNGSRMDIGCYEADWKGRYADDLGARLSVSKASPAVYETDSRAVAMVDGTEVTLDFRNSTSRTARQSVAFRVYGEGELTLKLDGETHTFTDTGDVQMFVSNTKDALRQFEFAFAGAGRAELINCTNSIGMSFVIR